MKLSQRGRDYLKAIVFGTIVASFLDVRVVLALCLSLAFAAGISQIILAVATTGGVKINLENSHLTCFKEGEVVENISIKYKTKRFVRVVISSVTGPNGVETISNRSSDSLSFTFKPKYSGRFQGLRITFDFADPLGLFRKRLELMRDDFTIDCYPASLLKQVRQSAPLALALGERAGRTHGSGQEFYSIDEYNSSVERKNIYWKKIASLPDERLLVKIRESNIPQSLSVGLLKIIDREQNELEWMDIACEGAAMLGTNIFSLGCDVELVYCFDSKIVNVVSSDLIEFRESLMQMSRSGKSNGDLTSEILNASDICITGMKELEDGLLALEVARKPTLLIKDLDVFPKTIGNLSIVYTGSEDVSRLVNTVVRR